MGLKLRSRSVSTNFALTCYAIAVFGMHGCSSERKVDSSGAEGRGSESEASAPKLEDISSPEREASVPKLEDISSPERERLAASVKSFMQQSQDKPLFFCKERCSEVFDFGDAIVVDSITDARSGRIETRIPVKLKQDITPSYQENVSQNCVGVRRAGWRVGYDVILDLTFNVERWDTGWRLGRLTGASSTTPPAPEPDESELNGQWTGIAEHVFYRDRPSTAIRMDAVFQGRSFAGRWFNDGSDDGAVKGGLDGNSLNFIVNLDKGGYIRYNGSIDRTSKTISGRWVMMGGQHGIFNLTWQS